MTTTLSYNSDGVLWEGTTRELARIDRGTGGSFGCVLAGAAIYPIERRHRYGWGFSLHHQDGRTLCEYRLARLRRGGTLKGEGVDVAIKGRPFSYRWTIRFAGRPALRVEPGRWRRMPLTVRGDEAPPVTCDSLSVLAFACWLISEWQSMPGGGGGG